MNRRGMLLSSAVVIVQLLFSAAAVATDDRVVVPIATAEATAVALAPTPHILPSPLLAVDQNRATVVDRIVAQWSEPLRQSGATLNAEQLRTLLAGLRSDHLLAASLAGTLDGLRDVIAHAVTATADVKANLLHTKALGDTSDDLAYTPVTPCRLADTRVAGGFLGANSTRDFKVWVPSGGFTAQGGDSGNCGVPANPAAVVLNIAVVNMTGFGNLIAYPTGGALPNTSVLNYQGGTFALSNGAIIPACVPDCANQLTVNTNGAGADVVIDIVGYFRAPAGPGNYFVQGGNAFGTTALLGTTDNQSVTILTNNQPALRLTPVNGVTYTNVVNVVNGSPLNSIDAGVVGATISGGGTSITASPAPNHITKSFATIGGGVNNTASGNGSTVAGGFGNTASGQDAVVPGGLFNTASGFASFAAGHQAKATTDGSFIWADSRNFDFGPSVGNFFGVRATGGVGLTIAIDPTTGAVTQFCNLLPPIASWSCTSDRDAKENFVAADGMDILRRLVAMPLFSWTFKGADPAIRSLGPTAQDFYAAFGLGRNDKSIANVNLDGVALAAIQGLNAKLEDQATTISEQQREIAELRHILMDLRSMIEVKAAPY